MNSAWEITRQRSQYHFDNFRIDPQQDCVTRLGRIEPFWLSDLDSTNNYPNIFTISIINCITIFSTYNNTNYLQSFMFTINETYKVTIS